MIPPNGGAQMVRVDLADPKSVIPLLTSHLGALQKQALQTRANVAAWEAELAAGRMPNGSPIHEIMDLVRSSADAQAAVLIGLLALLHAQGRRVTPASLSVLPGGRG